MKQLHRARPTRRNWLSDERAWALALARHKGDEHEDKDIDEMTMGEMFVLSPSETVLSCVLFIALYTVVAYYYHTNVHLYVPEQRLAKLKDELEGHESFKKWKFSLFALPGQDVEGDGEICLWSLCCPGIRWSDTVSKSGVPTLGAAAGHESFWRAFYLTSVLYFLFFLPVAGVLVWLCVALFFSYYRQKIRERFSFPEEEEAGNHIARNKTMIMDCFSYCCCMWCTIAQDARQVRAAMVVGHPCIVRPQKE